MCSLHSKKQEKQPLLKATKLMAWDVFIGMFSSNIVMYFIILTTGTVLYNQGIQNIETVKDAALGLKPLAGELSYLLFSLGIIGTGFLATPVLCSCLSYIISTSFNFEEGLDKPFSKAKLFYSIIIISLLLGLAINYIGLSPVKALIYSACLNGLTAPPLILLILHMCNNKKIMGKFVNKRWSNILGGSAFVLMLIASLMLGTFTIL